MTKPLITMTHGRRSWRNVLVSTPSLWTQLDFCVPAGPQRVEEFFRQSGNFPLDIHHYLKTWVSQSPSFPSHSTTCLASDISSLARASLTRTLFELLLRTSTRAGVPQDHVRSEYGGTVLSEVGGGVGSKETKIAERSTSNALSRDRRSQRVDDSDFVPPHPATCPPKIGDDNYAFGI